MNRKQKICVICTILLYQKIFEILKQSLLYYFNYCGQIEINFDLKISSMIMI